MRVQATGDRTASLAPPSSCEASICSLVQRENPRWFQAQQRVRWQLQRTSEPPLWLLRPEDQLCQSYLSPGEVARLAERLRALPPWWGECLIAPEVGHLPADGALLITIPEIIRAEGVDMFFPIRVRLRELLHDHVLQTGSLEARP